ncbi:hypothetical protein [uncultured Microbacterium sp.]|uniref:hypothetical protein n=1 Tax=uncultured Microbacterium sp. TaxID=191216 RepID=UPI0025D62CDA|nr:hypothetical protein [uncultured Microbacterium sp.]
MSAPELSSTALSVSLEGPVTLPTEALKALYRITGRSSVELRLALAAGEPVYRANLFGRDHIEQLPRLERTLAFFTEHGLPVVLHEWVDGEAEPIDTETLHAIISGES